MLERGGQMWVKGGGNVARWKNEEELFKDGMKVWRGGKEVLWCDIFTPFPMMEWREVGGGGKNGSCN